MSALRGGSTLLGARSITNHEQPGAEADHHGTRSTVDWFLESGVSATNLHARKHRSHRPVPEYGVQQHDPDGKRRNPERCCRAQEECEDAAEVNDGLRVGEISQ